MAAGSDRRRADYSPNNRGFAMADCIRGPWRSREPARFAALASRQLTTIRPPHISRSALAVCHWPGVIHVEFARKVPHSGVPEANPAEAAW